MRPRPSILAAGLLFMAVPAFAATAPTPDATCTAKSAKPAQISDFAKAPERFDGKCVRLKGYWRDNAMYPTAAEGAQPDAISFAFLDLRRVGLYLTPEVLKTAPTAPRAATAFGTAGACTRLGAPGSDATVGYCHYKNGAYLAVAGIELAK
jgi:hypothetical protein